jgi:ABC-type lipoprotein release transport system permease subunit
MSLFDWRSGYVLVMFTGAILAFLIFAVDKAAGLSAREKKEIAILKAVGWETSDVLLLKFWEGLIISLCAYLIGVITAYFHVFFFPVPLFEHALKGWSVLYPKFTPIPVFKAYDLAVVFAFSVVPYSFMTVVPTWKAAVTDPDAVMRSF